MALPKFLQSIGHAVGNFFGGVQGALAGTPTAQDKKKKKQPSVAPPGLPVRLVQPTAAPAPVSHTTVPFRPVVAVAPPKISAPSTIAPPRNIYPNAQSLPNVLNTIRLAQKPRYAQQPQLPGMAPTAVKIGEIAGSTVRSPIHLVQTAIVNPAKEIPAEVIRLSGHTPGPTFTRLEKQAQASKAKLLRPQQLAGDIGTSLLDALTLGTGEVTKEGGIQLASNLAPKLLGKAGLDLAARKTAGDIGKLGLREVAKKVGKDIGIQTGYSVASSASQDEPLTRKKLRSDVASGLVFGGLGGTLVHAPDIIKGVRKLPAIVRTTALKAATGDSPVQNISADLLTSYEKADRAVVDEYKRRIKNGEKVDPLIVMPDHAGNLGVEDGKNRLQAYKEMGIKKIPAQLTTPQRLSAALQAGSVKIPGIPENVPRVEAPQITNGAQLAEQKQALADRLALPLVDRAPVPTTAPPAAQAEKQLAVRDNALPVALNDTAAKDVRLADSGVNTPIIPPTDAQGVALVNTGKETRYASKTVPESDVVSAELQKTVKEGAPTYDVATEKAGLTESLNRMKAQGIDGLASDVQGRLESPLGNITRQDALDAQTVAAALDVSHDPASLQQATDIYDKLSAHYTAAGQLIQAAAMIARRSPEGLRQYAQRELSRGGVALTPELQAGLAGAVDAIRKTDVGTEQRNRAVAGLMQFISTHIPTKFVDKMVGLYKAGLLTGLRTQTGNALSNTAFLALKKASDPIAVAFDKAIGLFTGKRSKTLSGGAILPGAAEGSKKGFLYLKTGIDERRINNDKYEVGKTLNFKNPILNAYTNGVFRLMGAADQPVWYASYRDNLVDLAKTEAINQGLRGRKARSAAAELVAHPSEAMQTTATEAATKAVLGNETIGSKAAHAVLNASNNPIYRAFAHTTMPFTKVPSAFIARVFDYTPVGPVKEVLTQIYHKKFDQRKLVEALSEATTGTAGAMTIGAALSKNGLLTGAYPTDPKEQQAWKTEGKQENSIRIGDKWLSLNYVGPFGALLGIGGNFEQALAGGGTVTDALTTATTGAVQSSLNQSFLAGVSGFLDAIRQPQQSAKQFVNQEAASIIPTIVGDVAKAGDSLQRQANTALDAVKAKLPGARETLLPKQDAFGNNLARPTSALGTMVDPTRPTTALDTPLTQELDRLQKAGQGTFPIPAKTIKVGTETVKLTPAQQNAFNQNVGQQVQDVWKTIVATPEYKKLPDDAKKGLLSSAMDDISAVEKANMLRTVGRQDLASKIKLSSQQKLVSKGGLDAGDYVKKAVDKQEGTSSNNIIVKVKAMDSQTRDNYLADPKNNYAYQLALFQDNVKNKKYSDVQQYTKSLEIGKLAVLKNYSKDANELYGLSKTQLKAYLANHKITQKVADELAAMDGELADKGFISKPKYANGLTGSKPKKQPSLPTPKFGHLGLVAPPKVSVGAPRDSVSTFKAKVANIPSLKLKVAPERKSRIKIAV